MIVRIGPTLERQIAERHEAERQARLARWQQPIYSSLWPLAGADYRQAAVDEKLSCGCIARHWERNAVGLTCTTCGQMIA